MKTTLHLLLTLCIVGSVSAQRFLPRPKMMGKPSVNATSRPAPSPNFRLEASKISLDSEIIEGAVKYVYTYDAMGFQTEIDYYEWDTTTMAWDYVDYYTDLYDYTFDSVGNLLSEIDPEVRKVEYTYDTLNAPTSGKYFVWDGLINDWEFIGKGYYENTFEKGTNLIRSDSYFMDDTIKVYFDRKERTYDSLGHVTADAYYLMGDSIWEPEYKSEYVLDSYGNHLIETHYGWLDSVWIATGKYELEFDTTISVLSLAVPKWSYDQHYVHKMIGGTYYDPVDGGWGVGKKYTPYYSDFVTNIPTSSIDQTRIGLYPNPSKDVMHLQGIQPSVAGYDIVSLQGATLFSYKGVVSSIETGNLSNGTYLLKVYTANGNQVLKFVKD